MEFEFCSDSEFCVLLVMLVEGVSVVSVLVLASAVCVQLEILVFRILSGESISGPGGH